MLLTQQLEKNFSKDEILQAYLNAIYFGHGTFGIENASQKYFSIPAKNLSIEQSATLAGLIKSPKKYCPITNYKSSKARRDFVLNNMYMAKKIDKSELNLAINSEIALKVNSNTNLVYIEKQNENFIAREILKKMTVTAALPFSTSLSKLSKENQQCEEFATVESRCTDNFWLCSSKIFKKGIDYTKKIDIIK